MAEITDSAIEERFIKQTLIGHWFLLKQEFIKSIVKEKLIDTELLLRSLNGYVNMNSSAGGAVLEVIFAMHGRFQDIGTGRKAKIESHESNADFWTGERKKKRAHVPRHWYTKNVYGTLNHLVYRLVNDFDEVTRQRLREQLEAGSGGTFK